MAAVEQPLPMTPAGHVIPERRRRQTVEVEVIDVDSLDDDVIRPPPRQRRRLNSSEAIVISDDDDEAPVASGSGIGNGNRHRMRSLPPPPQNDRVPPVPRVPQQFTGQQSFPMRRRAPQFPAHAPGVVRPNAYPFPFENDAAPRVPSPLSRAPSPVTAAPRSHHVPVMGLGGALITQNRINAELDARERQMERARAQARTRSVFSAPRRATRYIADAMRRLYFHFDDFGDETDYNNAFHRFADLDDVFNHPAQAYAQREMDLLGLPRIGSEVMYKQSFTHPDHPAPGFTFDFVILPSPPASVPVPSSEPILVLDDDNSPVSSTSSVKEAPTSVSTLLVCALCLDPLVLGDGIVDPDVRKKRKVWALRCGHMLDGKCVDELMEPKEEDAQSTAKTAKGKGKAKEHPEAVPVPEPSSIRSRLRSRDHASSSTNTLPAASTTKRKGKGKGKAKADLVEAVHEWVCPVAGCGKVHQSVKIGGAWRQDGDVESGGGQGAIAIFV